MEVFNLKKYKRVEKTGYNGFYKASEPSGNSSL
jgi:hypothetical protein